MVPQYNDFVCFGPTKWLTRGHNSVPFDVCQIEARGRVGLMRKLHAQEILRLEARRLVLSEQRLVLFLA